jgi:aminoglycoside phosphotransferase (APT) family kinase protein
VLKRALDLVAARGWFDVSRPFEQSINLTLGACLWMLLTRGGRCDTYVKFSSYVSLEAEARRYAEASRCYPTLVPAFVGYASEGGLDVLVCRAVDYRGLRQELFMESPAHRRKRDDLVGYFTAMRDVRPQPGMAPMLNASLEEALGPYFERNPQAGVAERWLRSPRMRDAMQLPDMPQHGDFVLNNVGEMPDGSAVIFDWEDFGATCLPGLDLFTLELSLAKTPSDFLAARAQPGSGLQVFIHRASEAMGLSLAEYQALTPLHTLVFRYLKRNYGPAVRKRVDGLIGELDERLAAAAA